MTRSNKYRCLIGVTAAICALVSCEGVLAQSSGGYADPQTCAACHGRNRAAIRSDRHGAIVRRRSRYQPTDRCHLSTRCVRGDYIGREQRWRLPDGTPPNRLRRKNRQCPQRDNRLLVRFPAITRDSYFSRTSSNELIELPITWYSEKGGYWAMSPGYDSPSHAGFSRKATYRCMFCHNAYPEMAVGADRMDNGTKFPSEAAAGHRLPAMPWPRTEPRHRRDCRALRRGVGKPDCQSSPSSTGAARRGLFSMPS